LKKRERTRKPAAPKAPPPFASDGLFKPMPIYRQTQMEKAQEGRPILQDDLIAPSRVRRLEQEAQDLEGRTRELERALTQARAEARAFRRAVQRALDPKATTAPGRKADPLKPIVIAEAIRRRAAGEPADSTALFNWAKNKFGMKAPSNRRTIRNWISPTRQ
jgi:hypothetical protein